MKQSAGKTHRWITCLFLVIACAMFPDVAYAKRDAFFEGLELLEKGEYQKALPFFEQALQENPDHAPTYSRLAECHEHLGEYAKSLPYWQEYMKRKMLLQKEITNHIALLEKMEKAEGLLKKGETGIKSETVTLLEEVAEDRYRGSVIACKAYVHLLPLYYEAKEYAKTLGVIDRLLQDYPRDYTLKTGLLHGICLRKAGKPAASVKILRKHRAAIKTESDLELIGDETAWNREVDREIAFSLMDLALLMAQQGKFNTVEPLLNEELAPLTRFFTDKEKAVVAKLSEKIQELHVGYLILKGRNLILEENYIDAEMQFIMAKENAGKEAELLKYAQSALDSIRELFDLKCNHANRLNNPLLTAQEYEKISEQFPPQYASIAAKRAARFYEVSGQIERGLTVLTKFALNSNGSKEGWQMLYSVGVILDSRRQYSNSEAIFSKLIEAGKDNEEALKYGLLGAGIVLIRRQKKAEAINHLTQLAVKYRGDKEFVEKVKLSIWRLKECSEFHASK